MSTCLASLAFGLAVSSCASADPSVPKALTVEPIEAGNTATLRTIEIVATVPHRRDAWTQGLVWAQGRLYESSGLIGRSSLAVIDPAEGTVESIVPVDATLYAEGIAIAGDRLVQLTWKDNVALIYDLNDLGSVGEWGYEGEGWGLCFDGDRFIMSDGSDQLTFRRSDDFEAVDRVTVTLDGEGVGRLNELECAGGSVFANVWKTDAIVEIDPESGAVVSVIDASQLVERLDPPASSTDAVLNGVAYDSERSTFWLTGKLWPQMFEVRIVDAP